jgi:hypothetical protein
MKYRRVKRLTKAIRFDRAMIDHERIIKDAEVSFENAIRSESALIHTLTRYKLPRLIWAGGIAAALLIVLSGVVCFVLSKKVTELRDELEQTRRDFAIAPVEDSATINFYLKEHQDIIARHVSLNPITATPMQIHIDRDDIFYYEILNNQPAYTHPGIIVRGPSYQRQKSSPGEPAISNGHTLTLSEAKEAANFDLVVPSWLHPGYKPGRIRKIEGRDALQLLYTNGINSISLFEQPLNGWRGLEPQDFREYAVYRNKEQAGGTILAWRDNALSYVLIGNIEMSQLMEMAQSISAGK